MTLPDSECKRINKASKLISPDDIGVESLVNFCQKSEAGIWYERMGKFAEWVDNNYTMVYSAELEVSKWVNCKNYSVFVNISDSYATQLIKEAGITTHELINEFITQTYGK